MDNEALLKYTPIITGTPDCPTIKALYNGHLVQYDVREKNPICTNSKKSTDTSQWQFPYRSQTDLILHYSNI